VTLDELLARRLIIQSGKGGTGRTTLSAALAVIAARRGKRVLLLEIDAPDRFASLFGLETPVGYELQPLESGIWALNLDPDEVVVDFFRTHVRVGAVYRQILRSRLWRTFYHAGPGLRELICLGKIWRLLGEEQAGAPRWDCVIVDAPATGHGIAILKIAEVAYDTLLGPMKAHARKIRDMLRDPAHTVINICAIPEEMPVSEAGDLFRRVRDELEIPLGVCIANAVLPALEPEGFCSALPGRLESGGALRNAVDRALAVRSLDTEALLAASRWRCAREDMQSRLLAELARRVPLPVARVPYVLDADFDRRSLDQVADGLERSLEALGGSPAGRARSGEAAT
jgi:anion-transporting  ArsA/GET3 family ATPase